MTPMRRTTITSSILLVMMVRAMTPPAATAKGADVTVVESISEGLLVTTYSLWRRMTRPYSVEGPALEAGCKSLAPLSEQRGSNSRLESPYRMSITGLGRPFLCDRGFGND